MMFNWYNSLFEGLYVKTSGKNLLHRQFLQYAIKSMPFTLPDEDIIMMFSRCNPSIVGLYLYVKYGEKKKTCLFC